MSRTIFLNCTLVDGTGSEPRENINIVVAEGRIQQIGGASPASEPDDIVVNCENRVLMPGLVDCHTHLGGTHSADYGNWVLEDDRQQAILSTLQLRELMGHGVTSIRDISRNGIHLKWAVKQGILPGPNIVSCGPGLSRTGGHGDAWHLPIEMVQTSHPWGLLADGPEELRKAVRMLNRMGSDAIKVWATGGGMWENEPETDQHYTLEELQMIVKEGNLSNLPVLAHAESLPATKDAIRAGVWSIEHGEDMDDECRTMMKAQGITHVPTLQLFLGPWFDSYEPPMREGLHDYPGETLVEKEKNRVTENFLASVTQGVTIAVGSDSFSSVEVPFGYSTIEEVKTFVRVGMPVLDAIKAATLNGANLLKMGDRTGSIEVGKDADLIITDVSILDDFETFTPESISFVMKEGNVWKNHMVADVLPSILDEFHVLHTR